MSLGGTDMVSKNNHQVYQQKLAERKQRWGIRKLSVGVASVLLGTTFMLYSNHAVLADTVPSTTTQAGNKDTTGNEGTTSTPGDSTATDKDKTLTETSTGTDKQANGQKVNQQVPTTDTEEKVVATNHQDTPQGQGAPQGQNPPQDKGKQNDTVKANSTDPQGSQTAADAEEKVENPPQDKDKQTNANETTQNTTNVDKKDLEVTPANGATPLKKFVLVALPVRKAETPNPTSLPMSNQDIKLDSQPMLTEIINKPKDNWVYKNMKWYPEASTAEVKEILQKYTTKDESGRYYFAGAANYNESYHVVYLLARSNNLNDNQLYVTILHTLTGNKQEEVVAPGESKKVEYNGTGGTTHPPIFTNYDGTSVSIDLDGVEKGDKKTYGMVVGFAYGYDTGIYGEPASMGNGFMTTPMPTKTTTTIHYIDQATGDEIAVPKSFEGVAYQKYTITGEAPTIDGYTLKKSPKTTGYISPYKVGGSYDFRLDKHVVIKQTVIDAQGLVRVTAYYDGEAIGNTTRYLGNMNDNDHFSFVSHGKSYTYINQITSTNDGIVYYYAKDGSEDKSEVRVHYIDVTGNKSSLFVPGDGKEVATDKISGKLGEKYKYNVNLPTDYNLATNQANTVNGTYTIDHHDEYVYVVKKTSAEKLDPTVPAKTKVDNPTSLTADEKKEVEDKIVEANKDKFPAETQVTIGNDGTATIKYPDKSSDTITGDKLVEEKTSSEKLNPTVKDKTKVDDKTKLTDDEKKEVEDNIRANNPGLPENTKIEVGDNGDTTITYPDKSVDTITGDKLVEAKTSAELDPTVPGDKVTVKDPSHLTDDEKNQVKNNVDNANKDKFPDGTTVTVGDDGTATVNYPDGSKDTIPGDQLVQGQKGDTTDAGNITPTVPGGKTTVKDPSHLTDSEKDQVKKNVEDANKDKFPDGTKITVGDDGTATVTYPDGSRDVIAGTDLVIAAKSEDVLGSKYHSHKNGSNSSQADRVKGASTANGSIANAGNNLGVKAETDNVIVGVKGESDNAIGNNKATSLKTLPQTGTKDTSILGVLGMLLASLGLFGFKKKRDKE